MRVSLKLETYAYYSSHPLRTEFVRAVRRIEDWYLFHRVDRVVVEEGTDGNNHRFIMPSIKGIEEDFLSYRISHDQVQSIRDYWDNFFIEGACSWQEKQRAIHLTKKYVHYYYRCHIYAIEI